MMLILIMLVVFVLLVAVEAWWRLKKPHDEVPRKFVHISVGIFAATWPLYLSWRQIELLSAAFIVVVVLSKIFGVFSSIHAVERQTWGEVSFAAAIGILALLTHNPAIYAVAVLHMGLADGLAAIVGTRFGGKSSYKIFGYTKSAAGSITFLLCSLAILLAYDTVAPHPIAPIVLVALSLGATALENIAVYGLDNLAVPLLVGWVLSLLS